MEVILTLVLFTTIFNVSSTIKNNILYVSTYFIFAFITKLLFPSPINSLIGYTGMFIIILLIFKLKPFQCLLATLLPSVIFALAGLLVTKPYLLLFNITYDQAENIPIYRIMYLLLMYSIVSLFILLFKFKHFRIHLFTTHFDPQSKKMLLTNLLIGFFTISIQLIITAFYADILPAYIAFLSFLSLLAYFIISTHSLTRAIKLASTTQKLQNAEEYNKTLTILHDNVRGFKHDFDNIVTTIGGYIRTNDMEGLQKYYHQLEDDCQKVNNLYVLNPKLINNPGVYSLLTIKYHKAEENGIKINMSLLLDLNDLNMKIYEFTCILGILLDNAIDASNECNEKTINIIFRDDPNKHRQLVIIENTYKDKNVDTERIFQKGISGKENHTGLGLWEVRQILNKNKNLSLYTSKNDKYFSQQLEIYY